MQRLNNAALGLAHAMSVIGLLSLMVLAFMTMADGLMRWMLNQPIEGVRDVGGLAIAIAVSCCMPAALVEKAHIAMHILRDGRLRRGLDLFAALLVLVVMAVIAWHFWLYAGKLGRAGETTLVLRVPTAPFWYLVSVFLWCAAAVQAAIVAADGVRAFSTKATP
jgi:TRAP-type C4-dicarboxylate transport system permease small subunit